MSILYNKCKQFPESILIRHFIGEVDVSEIIQSWEYLLSSNLFTQSIKGVINDLTNCHLNMQMDSFHKLIDYLKSREIFHTVKLAVICHDPKSIVFPVLGEKTETSLLIRPFSTIDAAVFWIMND